MIDLIWRLTNQDFNIRLVDVKNEKNNGLLAGVSFPPSSRAPSRLSCAKNSFSHPFQTPATQATFERNWKSRENKEVTAIQHYSCKAEAVAFGKDLINTSCLSEIKFF